MAGDAFTDPVSVFVDYTRCKRANRAGVASLKTFILIIVPLLLLAGCTNQQIYNALQDGQKVDCQKYPDTRYATCMEQLSTPYDEYAQDREDYARENGPS